jgi:hypothetical protein
MSSVISKSTWYLLVNPSTLEATLIGSPVTLNFDKPAVPITPATTSPQ